MDKEECINKLESSNLDDVISAITYLYRVEKNGSDNKGVINDTEGEFVERLNGISEDKLFVLRDELIEENIHLDILEEEE